MHLPTAPSGTFAGFSLSGGANCPAPALANGCIGIHLELFDTDQALGPNSAKYTQWPNPTAMDAQGFDTMFDVNANKWGNYSFDPATTFPNIAITGVRRGGGVGPENYYNISHTAVNTFVVRVKNPGGTAIADATGVRLNLYVGAVGLGEPFHRLDTAATIDGDCPAYNPAASLPQADVCSGAVSLPDIETISLANIVTNNAKYTVKNGTTRLGGTSIVVPGGTESDIDVISWDTTALQDDRYTPVTVNGQMYDRAHSCMRAEALVPNDPNIADNTMQVNMNFVCVPGGMTKKEMFGIGWAGFAKYNPSEGADMFVQVGRRNTDRQAGWDFKLSDPQGQIHQMKDDVFIANLRGKQSIGASLDVTAPRPETLGRTLKENLMVPPKAGGRQSNASVPSGDAPVYVKVNPGSTLLVANYDFHDGDEQYVDLDGERDLFPPNGPAGLPNAILQRALQQAAEFKLLLAPKAPLGALVGSFDNFKTAFLIAEGAQLKVPANGQYLALGINDAIGLFNDNGGTGFRVKVVERSAGSTGSLQPDLFDSSLVPVAYAQQREESSVIPIADVMPTLCLNGYEKTGAVRTIGGVKHELYRYIGNVCWGFINVFPADRSDKLDQGDPFEDKTSGGCGAGGGCGGGKSGNILFPFLLAVAGLVTIGRFARRR